MDKIAVVPAGIFSVAGPDGAGMALHRRRLLALAAAGPGSVAGCIEGVPGRDADRTPASSHELRCPGYEGADVDRVVCSNDPPEDTLVFEPAPERADLPRAEVECRLENDREKAFRSNFYNWSIHRYRDGEWYHLGPYAIPQPLHSLPPGETHVRRLVVDNSDLERVRPPETDTADGEHGAGRHGLGPGSYAMAIESSSEGPETAYAAAFALEGDPVQLVAPETVTGTEDDGGRRDVFVDPTSPDADLDRFDLTVRRRPDPPREARTLVREQVYHVRTAGLRAALANVEGVDQVVVRGDDSQFTRHLTSGRGPEFLEYDGETFQLEVDPHDG